MKNYFILLTLMIIQIELFSQTTIFSFTSPLQYPTSSQEAVILSADSVPHINSIEYIQYDTSVYCSQGTTIEISIPDVQSGANLEFTIDDVFFSDPDHYSIQASGTDGTITLYITPEGIGGVIDLITRKFTLYPLGGENGLIFENDLTYEDEWSCASNNEETEETGDFCNGDCGAAILDLLVLITPEAQAWVTNRFGGLGFWFLFSECNNINWAMYNSQVTNKNVRCRIVNFTPDFSWSTLTDPFSRIATDVISLTNSSNAQLQRYRFNSDIVVMLTNNNYVGFAGIANSVDPYSNNKMALAEVSFIDPSRFTLAHEIAHHFGCRHSDEADDETCPFGKELSNGRNTIMAITSKSFSRIQNYSNPNVSFGGVSTGTSGKRNNAQQIRAAFCESSNNNTQPTFSVTITPDDAVCAGEPVYFTSNVLQGKCPEPPLGYLGDCGLAPYTYEWRLSFNTAFTNSIILGTSDDLTINEPGCPYFFLRLTVTSDDNLVTTTTRRFTCVSPCPRTRFSKSNLGNLELVPNPAESIAIISLRNVKELNTIKCYNLQGKLQPLDYKIESDFAKINVENLISGAYLLEVHSDRKFDYLKLLKN